MKRLLITTLVLASLAAIGFEQASAGYHDAGAQWTDYNYVKSRGGNAGYLTTTSENSLETTEGNGYCSRMTWSGTTTLHAKKATATTLNDYWGAHKYLSGEVTLTAPAGVTYNTIYGRAQWQTTASGTTQSHAFDITPVSIEVDTNLNAIHHLVTSTIHVSSRSFVGPSFLRFDAVC